MATHPPHRYTMCHCSKIVEHRVWYRIMTAWCLPQFTAQTCARIVCYMNADCAKPTRATSYCDALAPRHHMVMSQPCEKREQHYNFPPGLSIFPNIRNQGRHLDYPCIIQRCHRVTQHWKRGGSTQANFGLPPMLPSAS